MPIAIPEEKRLLVLGSPEIKIVISVVYDDNGERIAAEWFQKKIFLGKKTRIHKAKNPSLCLSYAMALGYKLQDTLVVFWIKATDIHEIFSYRKEPTCNLFFYREEISLDGNGNIMVYHGGITAQGNVILRSALNAME